MYKIQESPFRYLVIILIIVIPQIAPAEIQEPVVRTIRIATPPAIDGKLDDACWQLCTPATDFYMVDPNPGAPVTQQTYVYVCYDDKRIYFGIYMIEDELESIQATVNERDGDVWMDDALELIIDTYCDRRNAYYFASNLLGAKLDGRIIDDGRNVDKTWDGHWKTKSHLASNGWEMEMVIPFSELSYPVADSLTWGINFWRTERPHWENTSWAKVPFWCQISKFGTLTGLSIRSTPKRFEIMPYAAGQYENDSLEPSGGVDFEYDISSNLIFNATLLPDFAQIEADPYAFNLSYEEGEELYFPEKRPFFLEGGAILDTPLRLFYTRRMNEILAGVKIYGKIKSTELLALDVQTKDTEENFSVLRLKQELFGTTTLGAIVTHKQHKDSVSQAAGIDLNLPVYGPFRFTSQFALTNNTGLSGDRWAGYIGVEGETGSYGGGLFTRRIGQNFWVDQGFIHTYRINREVINGYGWKNIIEDKGTFQWIEAGTAFLVAKEIDDRLTNGYIEFWTNFVTRNKWRFNINGSRSYERYDELEFTNKILGFGIENNVGGTEGVSADCSIRTLYDTPAKVLNIGFFFLPIKGITVFPRIQAIKWDDNRWEWLMNARISYQITDKAFFRIYLQSESESSVENGGMLSIEAFEDINSNFLFGYEFAPGTILYLVYNYYNNFEIESVDNIFVAKLNCSFWF